MAKAKKKGYVTIGIPAAAWEVLWETLEMDSESGAFDPALRRDIQRAMGSVEILGYADVPIAELRELYGRTYTGFARAEGPKEWTPRERLLRLRIPEKHWVLMAETLQADTKSGLLDYGLKMDLLEAFGLIVEE